MRYQYFLKSAPLIAALLLIVPFAHANVCSFPNGLTTNPQEIRIPNGGGSSAFGVSAVPTCTWTVTTQFSFIHITSQPGIGSGNVTFTVDPNPDLGSRGDANFAIRVTPADGNPGFVGIVQDAASGSFSFTVLPAVQTILPGQSTQYNISVTRSGGFNGAVSFSASAPSGFNTGFHFTDANTGTLAVASDPSVCFGSDSITVTGVNGGVSQSTSVGLNIAGDFSLSVSPASLNVVQGLSTSAVVSINRVQGFAGSIALSASGFPSVSLSPSSTTDGSSTLTIPTSTSSSLGVFPITITGSAGCVTRSTTEILSVAPNWWPAIQDVLDSP